MTDMLLKIYNQTAPIGRDKHKKHNCLWQGMSIKISKTISDKVKLRLTYAEWIAHAISHKLSGHNDTCTGLLAILEPVI